MFTNFRLTIKCFFLAIIIAFTFSMNAFADTNFSVSPMYQEITLIPGEIFYGTFKIVNPAVSANDFDYVIEVSPFSVDKENNTVFEYKEDYNQIVKWITLEKTEGSLPRNSDEEIQFSIEVPDDAPAGGQYASIAVRSKTDSASGSNLNIQTSYQIAHLIYAEVAGETTVKGTLDNLTIPGFLFGGAITASAEVENEGNVHIPVTHTLQVFPLFSNEEYYTNEEEPKTGLVMPGVKRLTSLTWEETPAVGIFRVVYNVSFAGSSKTLNKTVIICPIWLLFVIIAAIVLIIIRLVFHKKAD